ncbi:MAG: hypothetical protein LBC86_01425 [Oscillospiraceae bacterium]|jgi:hypothetical protein|nr:hypothetical protein [Oscillospiraceae bacterium]
MMVRKHFAILMVCVIMFSVFALSAAAEDVPQAEEKTGSEAGIAPIATFVGIAAVAAAGVFLSVRKRM